MERKNLISPDTDIYEYYDLDVKVISPNMDPKVERAVKLLKKRQNMLFLKVVLGALLKKCLLLRCPCF